MRPWAAECWPSSGDSCPDHQSSRPCASAPGPHWTSCPWWPSSPCPRCCPSTQRNLRPEESYAQEPRWKPTGPDIVILKYSEFVLTDLFVFLRLLLSKLIGLKSFLSGEGEGWFLQRHDLHWYFVLPVLTSVSKLRADPWKIQSYHELWRPQCWTTWLQGNYLLEIFWTKYLFQSVQRERERERELYELWDERKGTFLHILTLLFQISKTGQMLTKSRMTENMKHLTTQKDFFSKPQMADSVKYWQWPALLVTTWYKLNYSGPEGRPIVMGHFRLCKHDYVLSGRSTNHKSNPWKYRNGVSISQYLYFLPLLNIPRDNWKCETTKSTVHLRKKCFHF